MDIGAKQAWDVQQNGPEVDANLAKRGEITAAAQVCVGLAGIGRWGANLFRVLRTTETARLVAIADPIGCDDADWDVAPDLAALLALDLEAVLIATPSQLHFTHTKAALLAGKHVFVEKPFARSSWEARELNALADEGGRRLMVGHVLRYHPAILALREFVGRGVLGDPRGFSCGRFVDRPATEDAWWCLAPHDLSLIDFVLGPIGAVSCDRSPTGASCRVRLRNSSVRGTIEVGMEAARRSWFTVRCEGGEVSFRPESGSLLVTLDSRQIRYPIPRAEPLRLEVEHFMRCVRLGDVPRSDGADGLRVVLGLEAGDRSQASGGRWQDVVS